MHFWHLDILLAKVRSLNTPSSASQFWNLKEKFHLLFFEKKSHSIDFLIADLFRFRQSSNLPNRVAKKLFEFPFCLERRRFSRGHIFVHKDFSVWYIANSYDPFE